MLIHPGLIYVEVHGYGWSWVTVRMHVTKRQALCSKVVGVTSSDGLTVVLFS